MRRMIMKKSPARKRSFLRAFGRCFSDAIRGADEYTHRNDEE